MRDTKQFISYLLTVLSYLLFIKLATNTLASLCDYADCHCLGWVLLRIGFTLLKTLHLILFCNILISTSILAWLLLCFCFCIVFFLSFMSKILFVCFSIYTQGQPFKICKIISFGSSDHSQGSFLRSFNN